MRHTKPVNILPNIAIPILSLRLHMRDYQKQEEHGEAAEVAGKGSDPAQEEEFDLFKLASSASLAMILKGPTKTWQNLKAFVADNSLTASGETIDEHVALASLKVQLRKSTRSLIEKSGLLKPAEEFRSRQVEKTISSIFSTLADTLFGLILSDHEVREVGCLLLRKGAVACGIIESSESACCASPDFWEKIRSPVSWLRKGDQTLMMLFTVYV